MTYTAAGVRVLVVEPHSDTRELYVLRLLAMGWEVVTAADAASACDCLIAHSPSVVVTETWLPDGDERRFMTTVVAAGLPIIALTTAPPYQHGDWMIPGLSAVVMKPCLPDELTQVIRRVLGRTANGA